MNPDHQIPTEENIGRLEEIRKLVAMSKPELIAVIDKLTEAEVAHVSVAVGSLIIKMMGWSL